MTDRPDTEPYSRTVPKEASRWLQHFILLALIYGGTRLPDIQKTVANALASGDIDNQPKAHLVSPTIEEPSAELGHDVKVLNISKNCNRLYQVKQGDTLSAIAKKYEGVTWQQIQTFNLLPSTIIRPGENLVIPQSCEPVKGNRAVIDRVFRGEDPVHEMVIRRVLDPANRQGSVPVAKLVGFTRQKAEQILRDYRTAIEESPRMKKLLDETTPAINFLNRVQQEIMYDVDFRDGQYHFFAPERIRKNVVFVHGDTWGGGLSALMDYPGAKQDRPGIIFGPYDTLALDQIRGSAGGAIFLANYVHELYIHPLQDLADNDGIDSQNGPVIHSAMGVWEDLARQAYAISWEKPDDKLLLAMGKMEDGGMARQAVIRNILRIGAGVSGEIPNAKDSYTKGIKPGDPTWDQLWAASYTPKLKDDDLKLLVNKFRQEADKMFNVPFAAY